MYFISLIVLPAYLLSWGFIEMATTYFSVDAKSCSNYNHMTGVITGVTYMLDMTTAFNKKRS